MTSAVTEPAASSPGTSDSMVEPFTRTPPTFMCQVTAFSYISSPRSMPTLPANWVW